MVDYTFTTTDGRKITEYRQFSQGYAIRQTPCLYDPKQVPADLAGAFQTGGNAQTDLLARLTGQKMAFDGYSLACLRQLVTERVALRDRNRQELNSRLSDLSGYLSLCRQLYTPDNRAKALQLERTRMDLEKQVRDEDVTLWRDVSELRKELILAGKQYEAGQIRSELMAAFPNDEHKKHGNPGISGEMPGFTSYSWSES